MVKARTRFNPTCLIPLAGLLVLAGVFFAVPRAMAQGDCVLPPGVTPPADPSVTAQQVEDGSARLDEFAQVARDQFKHISEAGGQQAYHFGCVIRQEGGPWRSGSTYLVQLTLDGRVFVHSKDMALSGRLLNRAILARILVSLGVSQGDLTDPAAVTATLLEEPHGAFDATSPIPGVSPGIPGASGYASAYVTARRSDPLILLAGFDLDASHVVEEDIDYGEPAVTAEDVVDRESLKAFVAEAGRYFARLRSTGGRAAISQAKVAMRDPNGPWRHGSVYLYVLDLASNIILFHGANPNRYELRPLIATVRDVVTGELVLPQVIEAAKSSPEGGFVQYFFDDPTDDTDSADIPKVGYARQFEGGWELGELVVRFNVVIGSGFYGSASDVAMGRRTDVQATVLGAAVAGLDVEFSRAIAGRKPDYAWSGVTDSDGSFFLSISGADAGAGYYRARARNTEGEIVGQWSSIPLNLNKRQFLELTLGGGARVVRVVSLASEEPVAAAKPAFAAEAAPEVSGLSPNSPNPFNSATLISYHLSDTGPLKLVIYNVLGQPVRTLVDESRAAGNYRIRWDARDDGGALLSTGVYIARLSYPGGVATQRLLYLK